MSQTATIKGPVVVPQPPNCVKFRCPTCGNVQTYRLHVEIVTSHLSRCRGTFAQPHKPARYQCLGESFDPSLSR